MSKFEVLKSFMKKTKVREGMERYVRTHRDGPTLRQVG